MLSSTKAAAKGSNDGYPPVGRMLCIPGRSAMHRVPRQGAGVYGLPADNSKGPSYVPGRGMGDVRYVLQAKGSCNEITPMGAGGL